MGKHSRFLMVAAAIVAASGGAFAQQQPSAPIARTAVAAEQRAQRDSSESALSMFARLAGQWEGQVEMRRADGLTSSSLIFATNRVKDGGVMESCLSGFVFGGELEAAALMRAEKGSVSASWLDSVLKFKLAASGGKAESNAVRMSGELPDPKGGAASRLEQIVDCSHDDQYVLEIFRVSAAGKRERVLRLDMNRVQQGSASVASFDSSRLLRRLREDRPRAAQASAGD